MLKFFPLVSQARLLVLAALPAMIIENRGTHPVAAMPQSIHSATFEVNQNLTCSAAFFVRSSGGIVPFGCVCARGLVRAAFRIVNHDQEGQGSHHQEKLTPIAFSRGGGLSSSRDLPRWRPTGHMCQRGRYCRQHDLRRPCGRTFYGMSIPDELSVWRTGCAGSETHAKAARVQERLVRKRPRMTPGRRSRRPR
jgi:hypothetical protein